MEKKRSFKKTEEEKLLPQVLIMLEAQGGKSLEQARKQLSAIGVKNVEAQECIEYYANNWNDVIHPSILSLSFDAVSERTPFVKDLQVMVLLLTAAMDIHDDVMDKSKTKNGKLTLYGKFGADLAILVGDAFLMESFLRLHSFRSSMDVKSFDRIVETIKNFLLEVGDAHLMELKLKRRANVLPEEILSLIEKKAAIFDGIAEIGAIAGKGSSDQISTLKVSARTFGYLVMLREEFIDMFEPTELLSRLKNEYPPLPMIYSLEDPTVKKYVNLPRTNRITRKSVQEIINVIYENQNVVELKRTMKNKANNTIELLLTKDLRKKSALSLASLIKATLEDL